MIILVPIGLQCINATLKKKLNMDTETLPFDWLFATSKFVYEMLYLLLEENMNIDILVKEHFFLIEKKAKIISSKAKFYTCEDGVALYNVKYNAIFPHDTYCEEDIEKYIRRFIRLKELIINSNHELCFIYSSQSSLKKGNFTIDDKQVTDNTYLYLSKLYALINKYNKNYKMIVYDSINNEKEEDLDENIILYKMESCNSWIELLQQIIKNKTNFN
jgi:hypothetical protein